MRTLEEIEEEEKKLADQHEHAQTRDEVQAILEEQEKLLKEKENLLKKDYLIIRYNGLTESVDFFVQRGIKHERGTEEFENWMEEFEHNNANLIVVEIEECLKNDIVSLYKEVVGNW